jgi:hypothetical protein
MNCHREPILIGRCLDGNTCPMLLKCTQGVCCVGWKGGATLEASPNVFKPTEVSLCSLRLCSASLLQLFLPPSLVPAQSVAKSQVLAMAIASYTSFLRCPEFGVHATTSSYLPVARGLGRRHSGVLRSHDLALRSNPWMTLRIPIICCCGSSRLRVLLVVILNPCFILPIYLTSPFTHPVRVRQSRSLQRNSRLQKICGACATSHSIDVYIFGWSLIVFSLWSYCRPCLIVFFISSSHFHLVSQSFLLPKI